MSRMLMMVTAFCLLGQASWAQETTAAKLEALKSEYEKAQKVFTATSKKREADLKKALADAETDEEKEQITKKFTESAPEQPNVVFARRFFALGESNPKDGAAVDAFAMVLRIGGASL